MTDLEFYYYLQDCAIELVESRSKLKIEGDYQRQFQLGDVIYTVTLNNHYIDWIEITKEYL